MPVSVTLIFGVISQGLALAQATTCGFVAAPDRVVERRPFEIKVRYEVAQGEARLNCELKDLTHLVLESQRAVISGRGELTFAFTAPPFQQTREILVALWLGEDWRQPLSAIVHTEPIRVVTQAMADMWAAQQEAAPRVLRQIGWERSERGNVAVLCDDMPGHDRGLSELYAQAVADAGVSVSRLTGEQIANPYLLTPEHFDVLILPGAQSFPAAAVESLLSFLRQGGDLIALGAPAFSRLVANVDGQWMDKDQYFERLSQTQPERILFTFDEERPPAHERATDRSDLPYTLETTAPGAGGSARALHVRISNLHGWDTVGFKVPEGAFGPQFTLTCFWAKGGPRTKQLSLEWREKDGSRWIAVVPLSQEAKPYALRPSDFRYWHDSPAKDRGKPGDSFQPSNAAELWVGLAMTHTQVPSGEHDYWIDQIGVARDPFPDPPIFDSVQVPIIDSVSPSYKLYPNHNALSLDTTAGRAIVGDMSLPQPNNLFSCHPRPQGTGFDKQRKWRWIPLVQVRGNDGEVSGTLATLMIHGVPPLTGALVASITVPERVYLREREVVDAVTKITQRLLRGVFLYEGGAQYYAYFEGEPISVGARVVNFGRQPANALTVDMSIRPKAGGDPLLARSFQFDLQPGASHVVEAIREQGATAGDEYEVTTRLIADGQVVDELTHPLNIWRPKSSPRYIVARAGDLYDGDRPWYPYGVNYMPSSECGIEDGEYFEYWLDPQPYDPEIIDRDLKRIAAIGLNMVSVFIYHRSIHSRNLLDLLMRCEKYGLKVNLSLRPGTPLDFHWPQIGEIIQQYRLAEMDTIFAYDLAWEPVFGHYDVRKRWDPEWVEWVNERYGGVEHAERDWGVPIPRANGNPTGPSDHQVSTDGEWRVMVAAYRRFVDDLLSKAHLRAAQKVKSIDPNHLISFRMSIAGDPTAGPAAMAYDFAGLAKSVDIMEPEGYGRIGGWAQVVPGWFTAAYSRYAAPGRPVVWAEFGNSVWDNARMTQDEERLAWTAQFYRDFLTMVLKSGANGAVCWFYPGGYRYNERSDFGIINPDGTWREITHVLNEFSVPLTAERAIPKGDLSLKVDRDADARGLQGIWASVGDAFLEAVANGRFPVLVGEGENATSADEPVIAVGNRPYNGSNPPKYLNAEFNTFEVMDVSDRWVSVEDDGEQVAVAAGRPVRMRASVGNNGWAKWLAAAGAGRVFLATSETSPVQVRVPIPHDVPRLADAEVGPFEVALPGEGQFALTFEMLADSRARFGERLTVVLTPVR